MRQGASHCYAYARSSKASRCMQSILHFGVLCVRNKGFHEYSKSGPAFNHSPGICSQRGAAAIRSANSAAKGVKDPLEAAKGAEAAAEELLGALMKEARGKWEAYAVGDEPRRQQLLLWGKEAEELRRGAALALAALPCTATHRVFAPGQALCPLTEAYSRSLLAP